jgi:hypothetical protein
VSGGECPSTSKEKCSGILSQEGIFPSFGATDGFLMVAVKTIPDAGRALSKKLRIKKNTVY